MEKPIFYFLCLEKRQPAYKLITSNLEHNVVYIDTLEELVKRCIEVPPAGLFIDILTSLRFGAANIMPIDNLGMSWPVMRCNITSNGSTLVLCMDTPKRDTLPNALAAITKGEAGWFNPKNERKHIRMKIRSRTRIRLVGTDNWQESNGRDLSVVGAYIHTYNLLTPGSTVEVELLDLYENPLKSEATVLWTRRWDESMHLPGVGLAFTDETIQDQLKQVLTAPENIRLFLSGKL